MSVEAPKDKKVILETIEPREKPIKESEEKKVKPVW
jgi:hypothetical protein